MFIGLQMAVSLCALSTAQTESGYDIAKKSNAVIVRGYRGQRSSATMSLYDPAGKPVVAYKLVVLTREREKDDGVTKTLIRFLSPPDTKGTALLSHEHAKGEEDRWLYLSETRQVKQIASSNKSGPFKGSELAYEDLVTETLDRYDYQLVGDAVIEQRPAFKVALTPKFEDSGYSKIVTYFDKEHYYPVRSEFFDRAGQPYKLCDFKKYEKIDGKWRAHLVDMRNVQSKRRTVLAIEKYQVGMPLSDQLFTVSQLRKE